MNVLVIGGIFREVLDADTEPRRRYGGSGLTSSVAAARFGARVALASYVGTDDEQAVRAELELAGVDQRGVTAVEGACGTFVYPTCPGEGWLGPMYRPAEALPNEIPEIPYANTVVAFGIPDCDPIAIGWLDELEEHTTLIWDRQGWLSRARDHSAILRLNASRSIYVANEGEALEDGGYGSLEQMLDKQPPSGFDVAVIKRGETGVLVIERNLGVVNSTSAPAYPVHCASTVGSGDIFAGVFAARLTLGDSTVTAAKWGCAAAAVSLRTNQNLLTAGAYEQARKLISN